MFGNAAARYFSDRVAVDHQGGTGFDRALGYRNREIDATAGLGKRGEHREYRGGLRVVGHVQEKGLAVVAVAQLEKDSGGTNHLAVVELRALRGIRDGLGHMTRWRITAQFVRGELPIDGGHVIGT